MGHILEHLGACCELSDGAPDACGRVLLVGEDNPYGATPEFALYCAPEGCSGQRLQAKILGLREETYLALWRTNLCAGRWSMKRARERAERLFSSYIAPWRVIVMLGRKVAGAFESVVGSAIQPFQKTIRVADFSAYSSAVRTLVSLPHPSGRNTIWNQRGRISDARMLMSEVAPGVPWGQIELDREATEAENDRG